MRRSALALPSSRAGSARGRHPHAARRLTSGWSASKDYQTRPTSAGLDVGKPNTGEELADYVVAT